MTPTVSRLCAAAFAFAALAPAPALAGDFNFTVPVALTNMPPAIQRGYVRCFVRSTTSPTTNIGEARSAEFVISDGRYSADVLVEVSAAHGISPTAVNRYSCELWLQVRRADGSGSYFYSAYALGQPTGPLEGRLLYSSSRRGDITEGDITPPS